MTGEKFDIKAHVAGERTVRLVRVKSGYLWYVTELGFEFPVPMSELGETTMLPVMRAMPLMRYVRIHAEHVSQARQASAPAAA